MEGPQHTKTNCRTEGSTRYVCRNRDRLLDRLLGMYVVSRDRLLDRLLGMYVEIVIIE